MMFDFTWIVQNFFNRDLNPCSKGGMVRVDSV